jgi:hypothetical protein
MKATAASCSNGGSPYGQIDVGIDTPLHSLKPIVFVILIEIIYEKVNAVALT